MFTRCSGAFTLIALLPWLSDGNVKRHISRAVKQPLFDTFSPRQVRAVIIDFSISVTSGGTDTMIVIWRATQSVGVVSAILHMTLEIWVKRTGAFVRAVVRFHRASRHATKMTRATSSGSWRRGEKGPADWRRDGK